MKTTLNKAFVALFALSLSVFLLLAFALVIIQVIGLVSAQPTWIDWASDTIKQPSIITAILTGLFGFGAFNTAEKEAPAAQETGA